MAHAPNKHTLNVVELVLLIHLSYNTKNKGALQPQGCLSAVEGPLVDANGQNHPSTMRDNRKTIEGHFVLSIPIRKAPKFLSVASENLYP